MQNHFFKFPSKRLIFFPSSRLLRFNTTNNNNNNMRRKNPHPQRAVNAGTVLRVVRGRREEEGEEEGEEPVLCLRIPDEEDFNEANHQIQKEDEEEGEEEEEEEITVRKGTKRKRGHECDVCEKMFTAPSYLARHMRTHTNEKPYECDVCEERFSDSSHLTSTCVFTRTRNRMNAMCAIKLFVILYFEKARAYSHERETVRM